jgi:hypothetical protein
MLNRQRVRKAGHVVRRVAGGLQAFGQLGQLGGHLARDAGAGAAGVQAQRVGPQGFQALADGGVGQLLQPDAVAARVGERGVGGAGAGELGVQLDDVAHVHHHHKGRAALRGRQRAGVVLGLGAGAQEGVVKPAAAGGGLALAVFELLALPDEVAAPVAVDAPGAGAAVAVGEGDGALEHVALLGRGVRRLHAQQLAELDDEALRGGQLAGGDAPPAGDELMRGPGRGVDGGIAGRGGGAGGVSHAAHHSGRRLARSKKLPI